MPITNPSQPSALFQNGIEAMENGIEDYNAENARRLSSAIRNVAAGVLLILKEKLRRLSEGAGELLLMKKVEFEFEMQDGKLIGVPHAKGHQTVDTDEIKLRLEAMNVALPRWPAVKALVEIRNHVEHHVPKASPEAAREAIAHAAAFLEEFLRDQLDARPEDIFSKGTWACMLEIGALNAQVLAACRATRVDVVMGTDAATEFVRNQIRCGACVSELVALTDDDFGICRACGFTMPTEKFLAKALRRHFERDFYETAKDGGPDPLAWCENCSSETFVVEEDHCYLCGEGREHTSCIRCGNSLPAAEQGLDGLCSWCSHMTARAMEDD